MPLVNASGDSVRRQIVAFGGLDRTQERREGALTDSVGLSSREWPCLAQRGGRHIERTISPPPSDIYAWDQVVAVQGENLMYGSRTVGKVTPGRKQFAVVNTKLCIFPDKKYLDMSEEPMQLHDMESSASLVAGSVTFEADAIVRDDVLGEWEKYWGESDGGTWLDSMHFKAYALEDVKWDPATGWAAMAKVEPTIRTDRDLAAGDCLMMPLGNDRVAREPDFMALDQEYADEYDKWGDFLQVREAPEFQIGSGPSHLTVKFTWRSAAARGQDFTALGLSVGDVVTLSGCETYPENNVDVRITAITADKITFDAPVLTPGREKGTLRLARTVPDLDFVCQSDNRLIGVSNRDKTVYISALGDPANWRDYRGLSVSSAYIPVGTSGDFTGCIAYGGEVLLFKENCVHRLMGNYDGNYTLYTDQVAGLQAGSERSLAILNEVLYYKGRDGVYAYTGATPRLISGDLGETAYQNAVAGSDGRRYYISMERADTGVWELLVYDTRTGLWLREENRRVAAFAERGGKLYMLTEGEGGILTLEQGDGDQWSRGDEEHPISWEATFTPFTENTLERKYPVRLVLRLELAAGAWVEADLAIDGRPFQQVWTGRADQDGTRVIPLRPGRCDSYQLRLRGTGRCLVRTLEREYGKGGRWT